MKNEDIGAFKFCPACGRDAIEPDSGEEDFPNWVCTCCERIWEACPCSPISEGPCAAVVVSHEDKKIINYCKKCGLKEEFFKKKSCLQPSDWNHLLTNTEENPIPKTLGVNVGETVKSQDKFGG